MPINQSVEVRVIARMKAGWKLVCDLYFLKFVLGLSLKERKDMIFFFFLSLYGSDGRIRTEFNGFYLEEWNRSIK